MKRLMVRTVMVRTAFVVFLLSTKSHAQSGPVIPPTDAARASQASCVILKRMGRIDRTKSRLYSLGISGKQFRYVEGKLPEGFSSHRKMTDHDVRSLQARGTQVLALDSHYTPEDLKEARASCPGQTGKAPNQAEAKAPPAPAPIANTPTPASKPLTTKATTPKANDSASSTGSAISAASAPAPTPMVLTPKASVPDPPAPKTPAPKTNDSSSSFTGSAEQAASPAPAPKPPTPKAPVPDKPATKTPASQKDPSASSFGTTEAALLDVSSTPTEADIYIDERLSGHTPSTLILMPGDHKLVIKKDGFVVWKRKFNLPSGRSNVDAALVPKAK